jgi:hypothetical protein
MGQYESINSLNEEDYLFNKTIKNCSIFLKKNLKHYQKAGILIPERFINQFGEEETYLQNKLIKTLNSLLENELKSKYQTSHSLDEILEFFRDS